MFVLGIWEVLGQNAPSLLPGARITSCLEAHQCEVRVEIVMRRLVKLRWGHSAVLMINGVVIRGGSKCLNPLNRLAILHLHSG